MNRGSILSTSAMTVLGLALVPSSAVSQQKSLKDQLVGAWTLVSRDNTATDGTKGQPFGPNPRGILILEGSGRYAWMVGRPDRPKLKSTNASEVTAAELGAAAQGFGANFGRIGIDDGRY
jgi:hypothetical protein